MTKSQVPTTMSSRARPPASQPVRQPGTKKVLAAVDTSAGSRSVIETALRIAEMTMGKTEAVHVSEDGRAEVAMQAAVALFSKSHGVPFRIIEGEVTPTLLREAENRDVIALAIGARSDRKEGNPIGDVARQVLQRTSKPVVVVPPEAISMGRIRRVLVPLEGDEKTARAFLRLLWPLVSGHLDLVVLHVFNESTRPAMLDRPEYDLDILGGEFMKRNCPYATTIELRNGPVGRTVARTAGEQSADLVVLSWSQDISKGRANVVREVLAATSHPVLLLPNVAEAVQADDANVAASETGDLESAGKH